MGRSAALQTQGSASPSGLGAYGWRRLCTSFQWASDDLCNSLALVAQHLCTSCVDPDGIDAVCRLIALIKCPGVCPIGISEVVQWISAKADCQVGHFRGCGTTSTLCREICRM